MDMVTLSTERVFSFGSFRLLASNRLLLNGETPIRLGSRAFEILIALLERPGELIDKDALISRVWPATHVAEGNLKFQVAALRRALGDGQDGHRYIDTTPGRGYRFVAAVTVGSNDASSPQAPPLTNKHNLPVQLTRLIGRAEVVDDLAQQLTAQRLLTITGPGGIGKTVVALDVAERVLGTYKDGVWVIDLAPIDDPSLVPTALASTLGLEVRSDKPLPSLIGAIKEKQMLLVLDNCEHVIEEAAALVDGVLSGSRSVRILATSREPLRVKGEPVCRLSPLESPPELVRPSAAAALKYSAVQLFVERAAAALNKFELKDADTRYVGDICRNLDGIPLAIELAAARIETFGVRGLAAHIDDRFHLLKGGRRPASPRHRTIGATLEWSYLLLTEQEQTIFRRLAIFVGSFTRESACAVAADADMSPSDISDTVTNLVEKSLLNAELGSSDETRFRLPETTRAYALAKLAESGEVDALGRRHAIYYRDLPDAATNSAVGNHYALAYVTEIDNVRAALTWAFAPVGDGSIAVALAAASAPIWLEMSLLTECHRWMGKAIDVLGAGDRGTRQEMVLQCALGLSLMFTKGMSDQARAALERANELAESLQDFNYRLRALAGLTIFSIRLNERRRSLALARRFESIAKTVADPVAISTADCMLGSVLLGYADYVGALAYARQAWHQGTPEVRRGQIVRSGLDHSSSQARTVIASALWVQGLVDQSAQTVHEVMADAEAGNHVVSLGFALTWCLFVASLAQELDAAEGWIIRLKYHSEKHDLTSYHACCLGFQGLLSAKRGNIVTGENLLRACLKALRRCRYDVILPRFLAGLSEILATGGQYDDSLAAIDDALDNTERCDGFWWQMPEALRIKGEVLLLSDKVQTTAAEHHFRQSLDMARSQGALSWELRTAMSLGRLYHSKGRTKEALVLLNSVYARFTEGFETADLQSARRLLDAWTRS
jgi:predicted ATPase/DNA-binding winged helix-turn-helix (wHTH) protein